MGQVLAVANMKGGVGKTATVMMLSQALAADDPQNEILIVDTDAQASASNCAAGNALQRQLIDAGQSIDAFVEDIFVQAKKQPMSSYIRSDISQVTHGGRRLNISLLASSPTLRAIERGLIYILTGKGFDMERIEAVMFSLFAAELRELRGRYAYIVIDSAPGISLMTEAAIRSADLLVVPTIPDYLSVLGLEAFTGSVWNQLVGAGGLLLEPTRLPQVLVTRRRPDDPNHTRTVDFLRDRATKPDPKYQMFGTIIPEAAAVPIALELMADGPHALEDLWGGLFPSMQALVGEIKTKLAEQG